MKSFDGLLWEDSETLPELGSLVNKGDEFNRAYFGLKADASKLPTVAKYPKYSGHIATGSTFVSDDTTSILVKMYNASTDAWNTIVEKS